MRPATLIKFILVAGLLLAVAAIAAAKSVNTERYKTVMIERVRAATGLTMIFAGPVKLRLGLSPRLSVTGLGLSVPGAASADPPLLFVDRVEARVGLLPLMFHQFRTERLVLIRPTLHLTPTTAPAAAGAIAAATGGLSFDRVGDEVPATRFALGEVELKDALLLWQPGPDRAETQITLSTGRIRPESIEGGPMALQAKGQWSGTDFELAGIVGPAPARKGQRPFPVRLKGTISGAVVVARGGIGDPVSGEGLDLELDARGDELHDLLVRTGLASLPEGSPAPVIGPYKVSARLTGSTRTPALSNVDLLIGKHDTVLIKARGEVTAPLDLAGFDLAITAEADSLTGPGHLLGLDLPASLVRLTTRLTDDGPGRWRLAGLKAQVGDSDLGGDLLLRLTGRPRLTGRLSAVSLALADFGLDPARLLDTAATASPPAVAVADNRILPNTPLALDPLGAFDLDLGLTAARLPFGTLVLTDAAALLRLSDNHLTLSDLSARLGDGTVTGQVSLDASERIPSLALRLNGKDLDLTRIGSGFPLEGGHADLVVDVHGRGATPRQIAASLDGTIQAAVTETGLLASTAGGIPARLLTALDGGTGDEDPIDLRCVVARIGLKAGIARADRAIAIETSRAAILGGGTLDLRNEGLDLAFTARNGSQIRLRGDLATPLVGTDSPAPRPAPTRTAPGRPGGIESSPCRTLLSRH